MQTPDTPDIPCQTCNSTDVDSTLSTSGRVKWFNNKAGYGFITVTSGDHAGEDVFVHHSAIMVEHEQYRYLVQGEYVTFQLCLVEDQSHKWQAGTVKGINDGKLMCETRLESRETRMTRNPSGDNEHVRRPHSSTQHKDTDDPSHYRVRSRGPGPREGDEWMLIRRRQSKQYNSSQSPTQEVLRGRPTKSHTGGTK